MLFLEFFLKHQLLIVNYYIKNSSNTLSNETIKTGVSRELVLQNQSTLAFYFTFCLEDNRNTSVYFFITEIIMIIIYDP